VILQGDTSDAKRAETIVEEGAQKLGGCDIFIQSVVSMLDKIYEHTLATEVPLPKWQVAFDTQARAFFVGVPAAAKHMRSAGRVWLCRTHPGHIQADGSRGSAWDPRKLQSRACAAYFAVALARHGVTVNAVSPGASNGATLIGQTPKEVQEALKGGHVRAGRRCDGGSRRQTLRMCMRCFAVKKHRLSRGRRSRSTGG
jgi:NAD(P)-dependent dehydrogenase (short-subunit alcohol dehydrogenase family)